jgi:diamine N-acetyltransferase
MLLEKNEMNLRYALDHVDEAVWFGDGVFIRPIKTQEELVYAIFECQLNDEQKELVNPAGFSIGRAYLFPKDNVPCLIYDENREPVGFISLCKWLGEGDAYSWSYYIDKECQGKGYGRNAADLAIRILKAANPQKPIKLATESFNEKAQRLYLSLGFQKLPELDGDDIVFGL